MTGLGEEVVTRCPTCGYGLTARRYAVPKECPLCRGSFDAEAAPALPASEPKQEDAAESKGEDAVAEKKQDDGERGESRVTLSVTPGVETGPLGFVTQPMPEPEEASAESQEAAPESSATDTLLEVEAAAPQHASRESETMPPEESSARPPHEASELAPPRAPRDSQESPQGAHIEHATPVASAQAEMRAFVPPTTKIDAFPPTPLSSSQPTPQPQPARAAHARESLEAKVSPEVVGRYADAYRVARATVFIGNLIKVLGVLLGLLVGGGLFALVATQGRLFGGTGAVGFLVGLLVGGGTFAFFFVLGVVISAQGQLIKATLDGAVNSSPFLTNDQRAEAMSLR